MAVATRKIQIIPTEDINETYQTLRDIRYHLFRLANLIMSERYSIGQQVKETLKSKPELKWKDVEDSLLISRVGNNIGKVKNIGSSFGYCLSKDPSFSDFLPGDVRSLINNVATSAYKTDVKALLNGTKALRNYKLDKMNIYFPSGGGSKSYFLYEDSELYFKTTNKMKFKVNLGRDKSDNKTIIDRLISGVYKMPDGYIKIIDKKLFIFLPINMEKDQMELDSEISVGVDLGLSIPAYCAVSNSLNRVAIGTGKEIIDFRWAMKRRREALQRGIQLSSGGKGRKKKLKALEILRDKESNWIKTKNHAISKKIIDFALTNNAGCVKMELLEGFTKEHADNMVLKNWTYFQLQEMIKYKADREGIKVVYIDPYHTSQTCSKCGHQHKDNRKTQSQFECVECGFKVNADYNAALNIAKSDKIVTKKEECQYSKLNNNKEL